MVQKEMINPLELKDFLLSACQENSPVIASFMDAGQWRLLELRGSGVTDDLIAFNAQSDCENLKTEQPVGICVHLGFFKYLFDTTVRTVEKKGLLWAIQLDFPDRAECIQRRMYHRQPVPADMKIKILFWHRGYLNDPNKTTEELYWQGRLLNLSAGGAQFEIESECKTHFKVGQLLGIQFTPMSYEKPILLESHIRYLKEQPGKETFKIGVEFLGLEASTDGREILSRILEIVKQYEAANKQKQ